MATPTEVDRGYWHEVLTAGGSTAIPRWTLSPQIGVAEHAVPIPPGSVPALLAAHAAVLSALSGEPEVVGDVVTGLSGG
ncbi:MAG: hypothetical protein L0I76_33570, partial [Pseudonocardia sp.]|nr:hypothetical protein [Pseudonocardia sp.]